MSDVFYKPGQRFTGKLSHGGTIEIILQAYPHNNRYYFIDDNGKKFEGGWGNGFDQKEIATIVSVHQTLIPIPTIKFPNPAGLQQAMDELKSMRCTHPNKRHVKMQTFEYDYCPDCKKEIV